MLFTIWAATALLEVMSIKQYIPSDSSWPSFLLVSSIVLLTLNPVDVLYKKFRYELLYSMFHNIIAPFGLVRFKEFFLGDILTSMVRPLIDVYFIGCYFSSNVVCKPTNTVVLIVSLIPFHIRFWQCINRYYYT